MVVSFVLAIGLSLGIVYIIARRIVVALEDWFYGYPRRDVAGDERTGFGGFVWGRVGYYSIVSAILAMATNVTTVGWSGTRATAEARRQHHTDVLASFQKELTSGAVAPEHVSAARDALERTLQASAEREDERYGRYWVLAVAVLLCCLGRISTVAYQPGIMSTVIFATLSLVTVYLVAFFLDTQGIVRLIVMARPDSDWLLISAVLGCSGGILTEGLLGIWPMMWGRSAGWEAEPAVYSCIACGGDVLASAANETGKVGLPPCPRCVKNTDDGSELSYNLRRKTAGWLSRRKRPAQEAGAEGAAA